MGGPAAGGLRPVGAMGAGGLVRPPMGMGGMGGMPAFAGASGGPGLGQQGPADNGPNTCLIMPGVL